MPLYLNEKDVEGLLNMEETIDQVRKGFELQAENQVKSLARSRVQSKKGTLNMLPVSIDALGLSGLKVYFGNRLNTNFLVVMFSSEDTRPLCIMEAGRLGQMRTGAASGVMTDLLARKDASVLACIGTGYQAETQIEAASCVRSLDRVIVRGTSAEKSSGFAKRISEKFGLNTVFSTPTGELGNFDILVTATTSKEPVIADRQVPADCHINAIGANRIAASELESQTFSSAKTVVVDSIDQAMIESGDLVKSIESGAIKKDFVNEAWEVVGGRIKHNPDATTDRTVFKSLGIGLEDIVTARYVYEKALKEGIGREV